MSVQPIEIVDLLAGLEEHRTCEHQDHANTPAVHADGNEKFVRINYVCCGLPPLVVVLCGRVVTVATGVRCIHCNVVTARRDAWTVLGPANSPAA